MARPKGSKNKPKVPETIKPEKEAEAVVAQTEDEDKPAAEPAHKSRNAMLNEINATNKERYAQEGDNDEVEEPPAQDSEPPEESQEEEKPEIKEPEKETPVIAKRKFKIDGQEVELTDEEIIERVQKSGAVDKRLEQATKLLEDAKKVTLSPSKPDTQPPASPSSKAAVETDEKELIQNVTKAVIYGDEEQVTRAFEAILGRGRGSNAATQTQNMSPLEVQSYVLETLAFERGKQLLETPSEQGGYSDIWSDPMLKGMFQKREAEYRDVQKDSRPYAELYKAIGDEIRVWRDALIAQHTPKTGLEDRDKLKSTTGVVRGAGGKVPTAPLETRPKTLEEKIEGMRARRGLN
ncbi:MAG: hypothetical protein NUV80_06170 [Candidatus Berkelbacteria bacterium]|nr:hypothetical protein [Candidatus Berkelbacteria bacterium]